MAIEQAGHRNLIFISFSQFGAAFSFNFINVFFPFYIFHISPYPFQETLLWVGAILGSTGLVTAATSTFWGSLTHHYSPKLLYLRAIIAHSILFFLMSFISNLHLLLVLRILQGLVGGVSTIGLIIVSSSSLKERISMDMGIYQSSMTLGQLVGPPLGSLGAVLLGFHGAFISASAVLFASSIFCYLFVTDVPKLPKEEKSSLWTILDQRVIVAWLLCLTASIQLMFLPSVLPNVFEQFQIEKTLGLKLAGTVVMLYTITAMIGTYLWSWLSRRYGLKKMITYLFGFGILFQALLALSRGIIDFTVIRMIQTGLIAVTIPLIFSLFLSEPKGGTIGFLNSARFTGVALGPIIATSILAFSSLEVLYLSISALSLLALIGFKFFFKQPPVPRGP
jgi:DHA1 family multidrug resistance protein-like MFS transporter